MLINKCKQTFMALLIVGSLILSACSTPTPEVIEKIVTQVVTQVVKETVVQKEIVKETVIVEGTPQVIEKEVTTVVEVEKVVTATPEPEPEPTVGGTLVTFLSTNPDTLDPHNTVMGAAWAVMHRIGGSLVVKDPAGKYVPFLAESWDTSEDGLTWTFYLKKGVKFHDGTDFTAHDVVWTFERAKAPESVGATGQGLGTLESAEAVDDYTVQLNLSEPFFPMLENLSDPGYYQILSQEAVEQWGEDYGRHPVGLGPYKLKEWQTAEKIVLERNPDFNWGWGFQHQGPPYIETIEYRIIVETSTQIAGMEAGEIDYGVITINKDVGRIRETGQFQVFESLVAGAVPFLSLNTVRPPFDDVRVRKALNLAVDRDVLIKVIELGDAVPQYGPISPSVIGYWRGVEYIGYGYNLDKAKALMEEAGWTDSDGDGIRDKDGQPLKFIILATSGDEDQIKGAQILQEQYKELGVETEIEQREFAAQVGDILSGNYDTTLTGIGWPEADLLFLWFHSSMMGALNLGQVENPELDEILEKTRTSVDPDERQEWVNEAQKYIVEQAYIVPLYSRKSFAALSNRVQGALFSPTVGYLYLHDAYIED
jgi:peptide/nickel transport system substrate-binding protein